jgi:hypothetical protein
VDLGSNWTQSSFGKGAIQTDIKARGNGVTRVTVFTEQSIVAGDGIVFRGTKRVTGGSGT